MSAQEWITIGVCCCLLGVLLLIGSQLALTFLKRRINQAIWQTENVGGSIQQ